MSDHPPATPSTAPQPHGTAPGLFVTFEGGEGVGKSTQVRLLARWLEESGHDVLTTFEPGDTVLGATLREALQHGEDLDARTESILFAADRAHHVATVVRPALARGAVVVCDRYLDTSVAYQGAARGLGTDDVERLSLWATGGLLPDVTVLLDLDPEVGHTRLTGEPDRLERAGAQFHQVARQAFLDRAAADDGDRWLVLDATSPAAEVHEAVRARVTEALAARSAGARTEQATAGGAGA